MQLYHIFSSKKPLLCILTIYGKFLFNYVQLALVRTLVDGGYSPRWGHRWGQMGTEQMGSGTSVPFRCQIRLFSSKPANGDRYLRPPLRLLQQKGDAYLAPICFFISNAVGVIANPPFAVSRMFSGISAPILRMASITSSTGIALLIPARDI